MATTIKNEFKGIKKAFKDLVSGEAFIFNNFKDCPAYYIKVDEFQIVEVDPESGSPKFKLVDISGEREVIPVNLEMRFY